MRVVVVGGGVVGLCAALLLARDGHDVTVLERDPAPVPAPEEAWTEWERRGVNQFRLLNFFQPRFRELMETNAPEVVRSLERAGALVVNPLRDAHPLLTGGFRETDARYDALTARRPVAEAAIARVVDAADGVTVRRGVTVAGLIAGDATRPGVPDVIGVRTAGGDDLLADVVVDASGRRSALVRRLGEIGARAPIEEKEDCGFVYYGRHYRSDDGAMPPAMGPMLMAYETVSILTLPADNGTWGVGMVTSARDAALRRLNRVDVWTQAIKSYPLVAHWLEGEPIDDHVAVMAKIEDEHRTFVVDGEPVATGLLVLADAWAATNPSVGRGVSIGALHAVALRDLLHDAPADPHALALAWHDATKATVEPWYRATLAFDRGRLDQTHAEIEGVPFEPELDFELEAALQASANKDHEMLRAVLDVAGVLALPGEVFSRPGVRDRALELGAGWRDERLPGLSRAELLSMVAE
jgi:2-polyprenyl-6-methoxyphenol hydroxylase-like FAD-dependent oxidoreductase